MEKKLDWMLERALILIFKGLRMNICGGNLAEVDVGEVKFDPDGQFWHAKTPHFQARGSKYLERKINDNEGAHDVFFVGN
ncbi:hypothetical protein ACMD2_02902 [Ananas comosus]|uniref:Uncharacterized protein n=1 Tax=Ananas comosus TaxID=4615 RepID=A0A199VDD6_ANACO|nr:hypothetical protein ACMD2_02902 [Ananas comosus]